MFQAFFIFFDSPFVKVGVNVFPHECSVVVWRIAEVVDFVPAFAEFLHDIREVLVSPAACYIYFCHSQLISLDEDSENLLKYAFCDCESVFYFKKKKNILGGGNNIFVYLHFERNLNSQSGTKDM